VSEAGAPVLVAILATLAVITILVWRNVGSLRRGPRRRAG
jgi:hypothetical protein